MKCLLILNSGKDEKREKESSSFIIKSIIKLNLIHFQGRCNREKPPCKYFHPPQHLKDQLLINGRNHLALKNALMQQMGYMTQPFLANQFPTMVSKTFPYYLNIDDKNAWQMKHTINR